MARFSWWKCIIPIWCIADGVAAKKKQQQQQAAAAAALAELAAYQDQCECDCQFVYGSSHEPTAVVFDTPPSITVDRELPVVYHDDNYLCSTCFKQH